MTAPVREGTSLRRSLSVWQAVGLSVALMAPSMAANINPQGTAGLVGRATPLAFFLAAIAVLLIAYVFVRLCQYYRHAGSVYVFAGATLGAAGRRVAGLGLMGTYVFYALVTSSAAGIFGAAFLDIIGVWNDQPDWAGFLVGFVALALALLLAIVPAKRAAEVLLSVEGITVALILVVAAGRAGADARRQRARRRGVHDEGLHGAAGTPTSDAVPRHRLRPAVVRGLRGRGDPRRGDARPAARHPAGDPRHRDLRRRLLHRRHRDRDDGVRPGRRGGRELHRVPGAGRRPRDVVHRLLGRRPDHPGRLRSARSPAAWPAWSAPRGCCSRSPATWRPATRSARTGTQRDTRRGRRRRRDRRRPRDRPDLRGVLRREAVRHVPVERHDRHPDPAGGLRAGDGRLHQADLDRQEDARCRRGRSSSRSRHWWCSATRSTAT